MGRRVLIRKGENVREAFARQVPDPDGPPEYSAEVDWKEAADGTAKALNNALKKEGHSSIKVSARGVNDRDEYKLTVSSGSKILGTSFVDWKTDPQGVTAKVNELLKSTGVQFKSRDTGGNRYAWDVVNIK